MVVDLFSFIFWMLIVSIICLGIGVIILEFKEFTRNWIANLGSLLTYIGFCALIILLFSAYRVDNPKSVTITSDQMPKIDTLYNDTDTTYVIKIPNTTTFNME